MLSDEQWENAKLPTDEEIGRAIRHLGPDIDAGGSMWRFYHDARLGLHELLRLRAENAELTEMHESAEPGLNDGNWSEVVRLATHEGTDQFKRKMARALMRMSLIVCSLAKDAKLGANLRKYVGLDEHFGAAVCIDGFEVSPGTVDAEVSKAAEGIDE